MSMLRGLPHQQTSAGDKDWIIHDVTNGIDGIIGQQRHENERCENHPTTHCHRNSPSFHLGLLLLLSLDG